MILSRLYQVIQDQQGNIVPGVGTTVTHSGTSTLALLYQDPGGVIAVSNPILNDPTYGSLECYVADGLYDLRPAKAGFVFEPQVRVSVSSYETGTWIPRLGANAGFAVVPVSDANSYATQAASYVRVGNQVTIQGNLDLSAKDAGMAGYLSIYNLPFSAVNSHAPVVLGQTTGVTIPAGNVLRAFIVVATNMIYFSINNDQGGTSVTWLTAAQISADFSTLFSATYLTPT